MPTGSVMFFKEERGFGFIRPKGSTDNDENVYLHVSQLQAAGIEAVELGQRLTYDLLTEDGKISATNIKLIE